MNRWYTGIPMANAYVSIGSEYFGPAEDSEIVNTHNIILRYSYYQKQPSKPISKD